LGDVSPVLGSGSFKTKEVLLLPVYHTTLVKATFKI